jgi:hypothetical protein
MLHVVMVAAAKSSDAVVSEKTDVPAVDADIEQVAAASQDAAAATDGDSEHDGPVRSWSHRRGRWLSAERRPLEVRGTASDMSPHYMPTYSCR